MDDPLVVNPPAMVSKQVKAQRHAGNDSIDAPAAYRRRCRYNDSFVSTLSD
jgi:hypothetical protein